MVKMSTSFVALLFFLPIQCQEWWSEPELQWVTDIHYHFCTPDTFRVMIPEESRYKCQHLHFDYNEYYRSERSVEQYYNVGSAEYRPGEKKPGTFRKKREVENRTFEHSEENWEIYKDFPLQQFQWIEKPNGSTICCEPCSCNATTCGENKNCCPEILFHAQVETTFLSECVRPELKPKSGYDRGYTMITSCQSDRLNSSYFDKCVNSSNYESLYAKTPVSNVATKTIYLNRYCAYCNGVFDEDIIYWKPQIICSSGQFITSSLETVVNDVTLSENCNLVYEPSTDETGNKCQFIPITRCNMTGIWANYDPVVERACGAYTAVFQGTYKNVFCFLCNEVQPLEKMTCEVIPVINISFRILLKIDEENEPSGNEEEQEGMCTKDRFFDPIQEKCVRLVCRGFRTFIAGSCRRLVDKISGVKYGVFFKITASEILNDEHISIVYEDLKGKFVSFFENESIYHFLLKFFLKQSENNSDNNYQNTGVNFIVLYIQFYIPITKEVDISIIESIYNYHDSILRVPLSNQQEELKLFVNLDVFKTENHNRNSTSLANSIVDFNDNVSLAEFAQYPVDDNLPENPAYILLPTQNCLLVELKASFYDISYYPWGIFIHEFDKEFKKNEYIIEYGDEGIDNGVSTQAEPKVFICRDKIQPLFREILEQHADKSGVKSLYACTNVNLFYPFVILLTDSFSRYYLIN